ncbi:MAG TPA: translation initiation factor Sui1 [Anaerolineaceae bacterium]|nr:translation initiation factor Sui1 [Anaerolineaceae bacterium]HPN53307.1 translation initiation factor Sui1 [Anaerolineaceae bacterium]
MRTENPTVYSTESGRICPQCGRPQADCTCKKQAARPQGDGIARIFRDAKGRKGKTVTLITGLPLDEEALRKLLSDLKRMCGTGGAVKDGALEIQGDHRDVIFDELKKRGFAVKKAGG